MLFALPRQCASGIIPDVPTDGMGVLPICGSPIQKPYLGIFEEKSRDEKAATAFLSRVSTAAFMAPRIMKLLLPRSLGTFSKAPGHWLCP